MTDLIIQAATDAALLSLLLDNGLMQAGEGGALPVPGVTYSHIGQGELDNGIGLAGRYAWVGIDPLVFGEAEVASVVIALTPHLYTGPSIRVRLGGSNYTGEGVPFAVTMRQARLALLAAGKLTLITTAINALPEPQRSAALITWEYSTEVQRHNGFVSQLAPALGMTEQQIDQLFIAAKTL